MGMLEARERQPEVIEPMIEPLTRDRDAERAHVGKVGQADAAWRVLLAEDHISIGAIESPPSDDAALHRAINRGGIAAHARRYCGRRHGTDPDHMPKLASPLRRVVKRVGVARKERAPAV